MDLIVNGRLQGGLASSGLANLLMQNNFSPACLRPYEAEDGRSYIDTLVGNEYQPTPIMNAATLRLYEWKLLDEAVIKAAKNRLRAAADLKAAGLTLSVPNAMGKTILETERQSDISAAEISIDGLREAENDRPLYDTIGVPLPIAHKDFSINARSLAASRNGNTPFDTTMAALAARKVSEQIEALTIGTKTFKYGGYNIYGYTNYPQRITYTVDDPAGGTWTGAKLIKNVLGMKQASMNKFHYGPWMLYCGTTWDQYLDDDYSAAKGDLTLRQRVAQIEGIQGVRTLDNLSGYQLLLVEQNPEVVRLVEGMDITTLQWESHGGLMLNFKVMAIMVPQLRSDQLNNTGVVHGS